MDALTRMLAVCQLAEKAKEEGWQEDDPRIHQAVESLDDESTARLSLDKVETVTRSIADEALRGGVGPALLIADEIRKKVRALAKKDYPPPSS